MNPFTMRATATPDVCPLPIDPNYSFAAFTRGPDHLPRRLTPKVFDELHTILDPSETTRIWLNKFGWDRHADRPKDRADIAANQAGIRRKYQGSTPSSPLGFRHSGWAGDRRRIAAALRRVFPGKPLIRRFNDCGSRVIVCRDKADPDRYVPVGNYCRNRWCVPCGNARSAQLARLWKPLLEQQTLRFITLTLRRDGTGLKARLDRLYACFRRLRATDLWRSKVDGAVGFLEVKRSSRSEQWHPHFHVIASGRYIPHEMLKRAWHEITGDSYIVDIRPVRDRDEARRYVMKYATKPGHKTFVHHPTLLDEAISALHGRRLMIRYGTFREFDLRDSTADAVYQPVMTLQELLRGVGENRATHLAIFRRMLGVPAQPDPWQDT